MSLNKNEEEFVKELYQNYRDAFLHLKNVIYKKEQAFLELKALNELGLPPDVRRIERQKINDKYGIVRKEIPEGL